MNLFHKFMNAALRAAPRMENPTGTARPLWRDYSSNQGKVNFDVAAMNGVCGSVLRAGISWGYQDKWFPAYWNNAGSAKIYRSSYHVLYPSESIVKQADNWFKVHPVLEFIPRVIDLEVSNNIDPDKIGEATWQMSEVVKARDGIRPIIYSRYLLINLWLRKWSAQMLNEHYWWLAQYLGNRVIEHPGPPTLPERVKKENVILHQTGDKKAGFPGEAQSLSVDWDRWCIGDIDSMNKFLIEKFGAAEKPHDCWYHQVDKGLRDLGAHITFEPPA